MKKLPTELSGRKIRVNKSYKGLSLGEPSKIAGQVFTNTEKFMRGDHNYTLLTNKEDKCIQAWETENSALNYMAPQYSTGGMIHHMNFRPSVIKVEDNNDMLKRLFPNITKEEMAATQATTYNNIAGSITGIDLDKTIGEELWEAGIKP